MIKSLRLMIRLRMKNFNMILIEKLKKYQPYHQAKSIICEYHTGEEILPSNLKQIIEQAKFSYSPHGKAFQKQTKTIEDQRLNQIDILKSLESSEKQLQSIIDFVSKENLNPEIINELERIEEEEKKTDRIKIVFKGYNK